MTLTFQKTSYRRKIKFNIIKDSVKDVIKDVLKNKDYLMPKLLKMSIIWN